MATFGAHHKRCGPSRIVLVLALLSAIPSIARESHIAQRRTILNTAPACYTVLNDAGTIGCRSTSRAGSEAPLVLIDNENAVSEFAAGKLGNEGIAVLSYSLFLRSTMLALQDSGRCRGVLLTAPSVVPAEFSSAQQFSYCKCDGGGCGAAWNTPGSGLAELDLDFPVLWLSANETAEVRAKAAANSKQGWTHFPQHVARMRFAMDVFEVLHHSMPAALTVHVPAWRCPGLVVAANEACGAGRAFDLTLERGGNCKVRGVVARAARLTAEASAVTAVAASAAEPLWTIRTTHFPACGGLPAVLGMDGRQQSLACAHKRACRSEVTTCGRFRLLRCRCRPTSAC